MFDVMKELEFNAYDIAKAFHDVEEWLRDINMMHTSDYIMERLPVLMAQQNPFKHYSDEGKMYYRTPTNEVITMIYTIAQEEILKRYPDAKITFKANGYNSRFNIDEKTHQKGWEAYQRGDEEE